MCHKFDKLELTGLELGFGLGQALVEFVQFTEFAVPLGSAGSSIVFHFLGLLPAYHCRSR